MPEENDQGQAAAQDQGVPVDDLAQLVGACKDAPGYVIFAAKISSNPDPSGNLQIDYTYRRYHFSFEDTKEAIIKFREEFLKDISRGLES